MREFEKSSYVTWKIYQDQYRNKSFQKKYILGVWKKLHSDDHGRRANNKNTQRKVNFRESLSKLKIVAANSNSFFSSGPRTVL